MAKHAGKKKPTFTDRVVVHPGSYAALKYESEAERAAEHRKRLLTPAQETMKADAAQVSREIMVQHQVRDIVQDIVAASTSLQLTLSQWDQVEELVRQGVQAGRQVERNL